ncbi:hypothetical protein ACHAL6_00750 [Proteiniclasticum sp. C24MP]|uniref:hypothetical protein n=1 Tax=Proteiniclasticum sp. C24MP TaxID=3374101 RepID=UPI003755097C
MSFKIEFGSGLDKLEDAIKSVNGTVSFAELFTQDFMSRYTSFNSLEELLEYGGYHIESEEDFEAIPEDEFDKLISEKTKFQDWSTMLNAAVKNYSEEKIKRALR